MRDRVDLRGHSRSLGETMVPARRVVEPRHAPDRTSRYKVLEARTASRRDDEALVAPGSSKP
jgi:hypothetical protein